ncbi:MAG TPA: protein translocase subunit SecD, partial [Acidimicrobiales bacterium]|nr:protein translocase subunit SecD [Acidimicrobiales bacterium]
AQVYFRPVLCPGVNYSPFPPYSPPRGRQPSPVAPSSICSSSDPNTQFALAAQTPSTPYSQDDPHKTVLLNLQSANGKVTGRYVLGPAVLNGHVIKSAQAVLSSTNEWQVQMKLTSYGASLWDSLGKAYFHKQVAIVLDHVIKSAPEIEPTNSTFQSFNGTAIISGGSGAQFTQQQAVDLATVLQFGALPVQLDRQTVQTVSPTLGKASLHAGLVAGLAGLALVMLYMVFYYRGLGIVVVLGLGSTAALLWAITSLLGHTKGLALDLSGVTGIIVSVGVTVDSYIVYFERLKDEVRAGKTIRQSVDRGFSRAYRTILAADLVSLIGAVVLYLLSIGPVKGFALFLGISTFLDIFTAYFFTRPLVVLLGQSRLFTEARWIGVAPGLLAEGQAAVEPKPERVAVGSRG